MADEGAGPANEPGSQDTGSQGAAPEVNWDVSLPDKSSLPEHVQGAVAPFKSLNALAEGYANLSKKLGSDKIPLPGEHSTDQDWAEVYDKLGRPGTPDEYELPQLPDGVNRDEEFEKNFLKQAHEAGLNKSQVQKLYGWYNEKIQSDMQAQQQRAQEVREKAEQQLKAEWGQQYDANIKLAGRALREFADDEAVRYFEESGAGNDPRIVKLFAEIGKKMSEDGTVMPDQDTRFSMTPEQARKRANEVRGQQAYWDRKHPQHSDAVEEVARMMQIATGHQQ